MVRQLAVEIENNFTGGVVTQATGLNFPKNACTDADNCIFHELGYVRRRPGFDFETNYSTKTINRTSSAVVNYFWRNVTGDGTVNLLVAQIGNSLYFWLPTNSTGFSAGALSTTVDLTAFKPSGAPDPNLAECQFDTGLGYLFVTHPTLEPFYVSYDSGAQTVSATQITVNIRDTEGVDDGLADGSRPGLLGLTQKHRYNTYNQGWYVSTYFTDFATATSTWPSNGDVWWVYKNFDDQFDTSTITSVLYTAGTTQAPKGHYILNAFSQDRFTASGVGDLTVLPIVSSGYQRPSTVAFYSGRAWYAGTSANGYESKVYFSQIIQNINQAGRCYSKEDPTSENFDQLEVDDGGWLTIPGVGLILKLFPMANGLIVFGTQGIYQVTGSTGTGFTALDYAVNKISSVRALSGASFVNVDGFPAFWTIEGVYLISNAGQYGTLQVQSLTDAKIKELYLDIPLASKQKARGSYDPRSHQIQWIYRGVEPNSLTETYEFSNLLSFNTLSGGWYPWSLSSSNAVKINGIFLSDGFGSNPSINPVVANSVSVVANTVPVGVISFGTLVLEFNNTFLVSYANGGSYNFTFANYSNQDYLDWFKYDSIGVDYSSYFITGYKLPTMGAKRMKDNYLYLFSDQRDMVGDTDFYMQSLWNFSNTGDSGKWSSNQRITHAANGKFDINRNRLKIRGTGYAAQFKYTSITGKPFKVIGWTISESFNSRD